MPVTGRYWQRWHLPAPTIVAESLAVLERAPAALRLPAPASPAAVARAMARDLLPPEAEVEPPPWLTPAQAILFRQAVAAVRCFGGALVAAPVGTGKTYVALAVAAALDPRPPACIVPAALGAQWRSTAESLGVACAICSHERMSRGRVPPPDAGLAIVDESHRFRTPGTRRHTVLARWLVGRRAILLSATPLVNRAADLRAQLSLAIRDDALLDLGAPSLRALCDARRPSHVLARVVLAGPPMGNATPERRSRAIRFEPDRSLRETLAALDALALSASGPVARLIRGVLWAALGSSPAALGDALRRYRLLVEAAADAARAGRSLDRAALRRWAGPLAEQTALWELLEAPSVEGDLCTTDLPRLEQLMHGIAERRDIPDPKLELLATLLRDRRPTLVFTAARATVRYLRERLAGDRIAWCIGGAAGVGPLRAPRSAVLGLFREPCDGPGAPKVLVTTDVAAEGLNLARVERVIHYDLPWNPARLEQREGRAVRMTSRVAAVETIEILPPAVVERRLRRLRILRRKRELGGWIPFARDAAPVEPAGSRDDSRPEPGRAVTVGPAEGLLASVAVRTGGGARRGSLLLWLDHDGGVADDLETLGPLLQQASAGAEGGERTDDWAGWLATLEAEVRRRTGRITGARWTGPSGEPAVRRLARRLRRLARAAARRRDGARLAALDRGLAFAARGHTAGELAWAAEVAALAPRALLAGLAGLAAEPAAEDVVLEIERLIRFRRDGVPLR